MFANGQGIVHSARFKLILDDFCNKLDALEKAYAQAIDHLHSISICSLLYLPMRYEVRKKLIKAAAKDPSSGRFILEFEWERIETSKLAIMHFANANMFLHARATEIYNNLY